MEYSHRNNCPGCQGDLVEICENPKKYCKEFSHRLNKLRNELKTTRQQLEKETDPSQIEILNSIILVIKCEMNVIIGPI